MTGRSICPDGRRAPAKDRACRLGSVEIRDFVEAVTATADSDGTGDRVIARRRQPTKQSPGPRAQQLWIAALSLVARNDCGGASGHDESQQPLERTHAGDIVGSGARFPAWRLLLREPAPYVWKRGSKLVCSCPDDRGHSRPLGRPAMEHQHPKGSVNALCRHSDPR